MGNASRDMKKEDIVNNTKATQFCLITLFDFNGRSGNALTLPLEGLWPGVY